MGYESRSSGFDVGWFAFFLGLAKFHMVVCFRSEYHECLPFAGIHIEPAHAAIDNRSALKPDYLDPDTAASEMKAGVNESPAEIQSFRISMEDVCRRSLSRQSTATLKADLRKL